VRIGKVSNSGNGEGVVGDNWPITWADDGYLYTSYGDGEGFGRVPRVKKTLGFARITGAPPAIVPEDIPSDADTPGGGGAKGIKSSGLLMVDHTLWMFVRNYQVDGNYRNSRLAWSKDYEKTWKWADWFFSGTFGCPDFVQFGPDYAGARDGYVYVASQDNDDAYAYSPDVVLARVSKRKIADRAAYQFFAGFGGNGKPVWSADIARRKAIFSDPRGVMRVSVTYSPALHRYILTSSHRVGEGPHNASLGVFEAPEPWGPWRTVYYEDHFAGDDRVYHLKFPTKWMSSDGSSMWLLYSGLGDNNEFVLRKATLDLASGARRGNE
jgi:hypothetical protein